MRTHPRLRALFALLAVIGLAVAIAACGDDSEDSTSTSADTGSGSDANLIQSNPDNGQESLTIGSKNFTEQYILGELYAQTLRKAGFRVVLKSDIGSSEIIDKALTAGSLDMYPEYTGVLLSEIAGDRRRPSTARQAYERAKAFEEKRGFTLLEPTPFSDSNALAVLPAYAKKQGLKSMADLKGIRGLRVGALPEFQTRFGYPRDEPGQANLTLACNAVGQAFDCLSFTIEMPFKDHDDNPQPRTGWNGARSKKLGRDVLTVLAQMVGTLR